MVVALRHLTRNRFPYQARMRLHTSKGFVPATALSVLATAFFAGCGSDVEVQVVDKPIFDPTAAATANMVQTPEVTSTDLTKGAADLRWTIPAGWEMTPPPRMILARFVAPSKATLSISNLSGGGTDMANLTRWAGQLGVDLDSLDASSVKRPVSNPGLQLSRYYLASDSKAFDVGITRLHGTAWFFKMEGSPAAVDEARGGFESFLSSLIHYHPPGEHVPADQPLPLAQSAPAQMPEPKQAAPAPTPKPAAPVADGKTRMEPLPGMEAQVAQIEGASWAAPAQWTAGGNRPMRKGTYIWSGSAGQAELSITAFPGDVGGLGANINRWRGQIGLPALGGQELQDQTMTKSVAGIESFIVWMQGDSAAILGAIVPRATETWFFKATGPAVTLEENRQAFVDFLETVKF